MTPDTGIDGENSTQGGNRFSYVHNNPIRYKDPTGHQAAAELARQGTQLMSTPSPYYVAQIAGVVVLGFATAVAIYENREAIKEAASNLIDAAKEKIKDTILNAKDSSKEKSDKADKVSPQERGRKSEEKVLKDIGKTKNKVKVSSDEGNSIPDILDDKQVGEIKDTKTVSNTRQLRIQREAAKVSGKDHNIYTGNRTKVSKPVERSGSNIIRRPDLGP